MMPAARPTAPPRPVLAVCPECAYVSTLAALLTGFVIEGFAQCPYCGIGTPPREWRAP